MEVVITLDTKSPEAKAFYKYSKTLFFVKTQGKKRELSDEETEKIAQELGDISSADMTACFMLNRFKKKGIKNDISNGQ